MNYKEDIKIDESALDVECLNQPELALKWGVHWADCSRTLQQAEENVKLVRSELIELVTSDPEEHLDEGVKPTGPIVEAFYRNHKDHIKAKKELVQAQYELNVAIVAKGEFSSGRKKSLELLVELHGQNYFAGPSVPRDLSLESKRAISQKESDKGVASKLQRKKK